MPTNILMPALSPTMESGTLAKWLVKEGDAVNSGDLLAEIETDKAVMEFEAVDEGVVGKLLVQEGAENIGVNTPIAILVEDGEEVPEGALAESSDPKPPSESAAAETAAARSEDDPPSESSERPGKAPGKLPAAQPRDRVLASPLAKRIAESKGLDLSAIKGSGPRGRIVKADVEGAEAASFAPSPAAHPAGMAPEAVSAMYEGRDHEVIALDGMRKTIAARLTEAKQTIPHFYLRRDIRIDKLIRLRSEVNDVLAERGIKLSINDFIIKAGALALQAVPEANAVWAGDRIFQFKASDVAVAVAVDGGLFTPVLLDAERKSLAELSAEMKDLAKRARERKLKPQEYQGGSFAISNLGMYGVESFDAVINPPHGSILAVGAGVAKAIVQDGEIRAATLMSATLSADHRVIDGALGARFLAAIVERLENPFSLLV